MGRGKKGVKQKKDGQIRDRGIIEYGFFLIFNLLLVYLLSQIIRGVFDWPIF